MAAAWAVPVLIIRYLRAHLELFSQAHSEWAEWAERVYRLEHLEASNERKYASSCREDGERCETRNGDAFDELKQVGRK